MNDVSEAEMIVQELQALAQSACEHEWVWQKRENAFLYCRLCESKSSIYRDRLYSYCQNYTGTFPALIKERKARPHDSIR